MQPTKSKASLQIAWTDKLDVFQQHGRQRELAPNHVKKIQDSIAQNGFLTAKPIQCFRDGKFLRVIDGHHRLQAARNLKVGVYYVIVDASENDIIGQINSAVRRWDNNAFINYHAMGGNKHFLKLREYIEKGLPASVATAALNGQSGSGGSQSQQIAHGTWKVRSTTLADKLVEVMAVLDGIAMAKSTAFLSALAVLLRLPQFDIEWLMQRLLKYPNMLERRSNREQMLDVIEEAYNFNKRDKVNLAFLAKEFLRANKDAHFKKQASTKEA